MGRWAGTAVCLDTVEEDRNLCFYRELVQSSDHQACGLVTVSGSSDSFTLIFFFLWRCGPTRAMTSFLRFLDHTQRHTTVSVGLLWTSDQPVAKTSTWQHTTLTTERQTDRQTDRHPCPRQDSKPQSQQGSSHRSTPYTERALGSVPKHIFVLKTFHIFNYIYIYIYIYNNFSAGVSIV